MQEEPIRNKRPNLESSSFFPFNNTQRVETKSKVEAHLLQIKLLYKMIITIVQNILTFLSDFNKYYNHMGV